MISLKEYTEVRPWIRLVLGVVFDIARYRDDVQAAYLRADQHLIEFEQFPGSIKRD